MGSEYGYDMQLRMLLEKKEDMKRCGLASPDNTAALALTFSYAIGPSAMAGRRAVRGLG